jgi:hypothetical protein
MGKRCLNDFDVRSTELDVMGHPSQEGMRGASKADEKRHGNEFLFGDVFHSFILSLFMNRIRIFVDLWPTFSSNDIKNRELEFCS